MYGKTKRWLSLLLVLSLCMTALIGCGKTGEENSSGNADKQSTQEGKPDPNDSKPMEVSVIILDRGKVAAEEGTYEDNRWTQWINEKSGVKVKWVPVPRTQSIQKMNALIAAGEAPDMLWEYGTGFMLNLKSQGVIQPVDEYIQKYSTVYRAYLEKHPELKPYITADGKMYGVTSARGIDTIANHAMWIRKDWLDKLGLKTPTTDEELLNVARAFKTKDPDGNGKDDTYGVAFNYNWDSIIKALYFCSETYIENGKAAKGDMTDRYADVLAFRKTLFQEGLIDKEYITDKNFQRERQIWVTGKAGIYLGSWAPPEFRDLKQNDPSAELVPLEPVSTKYGKNGLFQEPPALRMIVFNKDMKNPKAAMKLLDWMIDENWFTLQFGQEGVHHKLVEGVPQVIDAEKNKKELSYAGEYPLLTQWSPKPEWLKIMAASDSISQEEARLKGMSLTTAMKNKYKRDIPYAPVFPELTELAQFGDLRDEIVTQVIIGGKSPQWGLEQIRNEYKRLGGEKEIKLLQDWYDQNKNDFGE